MTANRDDRTADEREFDHDRRGSAISVAQPVAELSTGAIPDDQFRLLADNLPTLCWMANGDGYIVWYNRRWHEYCGSTPDEMEGWGWQSVHDPKRLPEVLERWKASIATGKPFEMTFPLKGADGIFRPFLTRVEPVVGPEGDVVRWFGINTEITDQKRAESVADAQSRVLQLAFRETPLAEALEALVRAVEEQSTTEVRGSILLVEGEHLRHGAAPNLPDAYNKAIDGIAIGPEVGSCGTAAHGEAPVYVADIASDPLWKDFRELALAHGLRACWSTPILSSSGEVLGTFAMYYREPRSPTSEDLELVDFVTGSAALIIDRKRGEQALRESEARFREVANAAPVLIWLADHENRGTWYNKAWLDFTGRTMEQDLGFGWIENVHPDDRARCAEICGDAFERREPFRFDFRLRRADGEWRVIDDSGVPRFANDGTFLGYIGSCIDVTDARLTERALRESEERYRLIVEGAEEVAIITLDEHGIIASWNTGAERLLGLSEEEAIGRHGSIFFTDEDIASGAPEHEMNRAEADGRAINERWHQRKDGSRFWGSGLMMRLEPRGSGFLKIFRDRTVEHEGERALQDQGRILETLNRTGAAVAGELDLQKVVQMVTDAGVELTGAEFGAFFYNVLNDQGESYMLYTLSGAEPSQFDFGMPRNTAVFAHTFDGIGTVRSDDITKDPRYGKNPPHNGMPKGHLPVRSYLAVPVIGRSDEVIGGLFFGHSATSKFNEGHERLMTGIAAQAAIAIDNARLYQAVQRANETLEQRVEERTSELERANEALRQAQKMEAIGQLTGGIAHDFNNMLTVIRGSADVLRRRDLDEERQQRYLQAIADTSDRAARLTGQLLAFARRQALKPEVFDAAQRVESISEMMQTLLGSRIRLTIESACEDCFIETDAAQFETALVNMTVNARDAMDGEGELRICIEFPDDLPAALQATDGRAYIAVSVSDSGHGIPPEDLDKIFEPFFTTKETGKGTGLGLSQVYGFAKQSGGEVLVESGRERGSTFTLYLPRAPEGRTTAETVKVPAGELPSTGRVLVVEDNIEVGRFAEQVLGEIGFEATLACNAEEALALLEQDEGFDLVFSDVVMPGIGGVELARKIRERWPDLPVVLTSGYSHVLAARAEHAFPLLHKPYSLEGLSKVLGNALAGKHDEHSADK